MLNLMIVLALVEPCTALDERTYYCPPDADSSVEVETGKDLVLVTTNPSGETFEIDGWDCAGDWCTFDYGLVSEDDVMELPPGASGGGCEPGPGPTPPAPNGGTIKKPPTTVVVARSPTAADGPGGI